MINVKQRQSSRGILDGNADKNATGTISTARCRWPCRGKHCSCMPASPAGDAMGHPKEPHGLAWGQFWPDGLLPPLLWPQTVSPRAAAAALHVPKAGQGRQEPSRRRQAGWNGGQEQHGGDGTASAATCAVSHLTSSTRGGSLLSAALREGERPRPGEAGARQRREGTSWWQGWRWQLVSRTASLGARDPVGKAQLGLGAEIQHKATSAGWKGPPSPPAQPCPMLS